MIRTSVSPKLIKHTLIKGFALGALGILGLLYGGVFLPVGLMKTWGLLLFLVCLGLITIGLLPYRHLSLLQSKPNELRLSESALEFWSRGQSRLIIPVGSIERMDYVNDGIAVRIKKGEKGKVVKYQSDLDLDRYQVKTKGAEGADYLFRYFSRRSFEELCEGLRD